MLYEFLTTNRQELIDRCKNKVAQRPGPPPSTTLALEHGVTLLIGQMVDTLRAEQRASAHGEPLKLPREIGASARKHGRELYAKGLTLDSVVHDYGDLCQAVTELAHETDAPITVDEFHTFNRCLDDAIAEAVTEFGRRQAKSAVDAGARSVTEPTHALAHALHDRANTAMLAFEALKSGRVAIHGATGEVLYRNLKGLTALIDRALADAR